MYSEMSARADKEKRQKLAKIFRLFSCFAVLFFPLCTCNFLLCNYFEIPSLWLPINFSLLVKCCQVAKLKGI